MMSKTERGRRPASGSFDANSRPMDEAAVDVAKRFCMIRVPRRARLIGLGLTVGIILAAGGSTSADAQSRSPNANVVDELLAQLGANPSTIARSSVPTCSSAASSSSPLIILDNQTYALCPPASCFVFSDVAYCACDVEFGDSISETFTYDNGKNVCTVNEEGAANGTFMVSTFSVPESVLKGGDQAIYTCPSGSDGAYAQCNGGICFTNTEGQSFPGFDEPLAKNQIICSCPITEQNPRSPVGYQILGPYPCQPSFFENCKEQTANSHTGSTLFVGAPTGTPRLLAILLTGMNPQVNECPPPASLFR